MNSFLKFQVTFSAIGASYCSYRYISTMCEDPKDGEDVVWNCQQLHNIPRFLQIFLQPNKKTNNCSDRYLWISLFIFVELESWNCYITINDQQKSICVWFRKNKYNLHDARNVEDWLGSHTSWDLRLRSNLLRRCSPQNSHRFPSFDSREFYFLHLQICCWTLFAFVVEINSDSKTGIKYCRPCERERRNIPDIP